MRPLKSSGSSGARFHEQFRNRRKAYFHGKYNKEIFTLIIAISILSWILNSAKVI
ncbi:hypothetical protein Q4574_01275 [Aliiglaciecola sp. 3_MG-2023]|uniref:hypothetical protein n=1 Tax=Aliiglaciecola sp. 3_MG-2023 TaxID=3062644 RepID=UPI0026E14649|nr:hypothetical protein [Aliiglaciecola sp. 3_MG-2023]MDO6691889.1 hypothetical protein [Aliiglaciecola sp. 3_MG-2023]